MEQTILQLAGRTLGINEWAFDPIYLRGGELEICACVKAYGDGWSEYYNSDEPDGGEIPKAPTLAKEIMHRFPSIKRVSVAIHHD